MHGFKCNRLTLSLEKTNYSIFHRPRAKIPSFLDNLKCEQHTIQRMTTVKYLGLYLDDKLTWTDHVTQTSKKLTRIISSFKIIKHFVPDKCKKQLFHAHINSRLKYGLEVYGHTTKNNIQKLQVLQNKSLKVLFNKDWYTPTSQLHKDLQLLKLVDNFNHSILQMVYMQRNNLLPPIFDDYLILRR